MSNVEQTIETIREVIERRMDSRSFRWLLCWSEGRLQCRPVERPIRPCITFRRLTQHQIEEGFECNEWFTVAEEVIKVARTKV